MEDAVGPVSEQVKCKLRVQPPDDIDHLRHRLPGLNAPFPCVRRGTELTQFFRDRARSDGAKGTARHAAGGLYDIHPLGLNFQVVRHVLAALRTRKLALGWDLEHRVPIGLPDNSLPRPAFGAASALRWRTSPGTA